MIWSVGWFPAALCKPQHMRATNRYNMSPRLATCRKPSRRAVSPYAAAILGGVAGALISTLLAFISPMFWVDVDRHQLQQQDRIDLVPPLKP